MTSFYSKVLFLAVLLIFLMGTVMVYNTSSAEILDRCLEKNLQIALFKQLAYGLVGVLCAYFVWRIGYDHILRLSPILLGICTLCLVLVLIPGVGQMINGAKRWLKFGAITVQPSEFAKILIPLFFIDYVSRTKEIFFWQFVKLFMVLTIPLGLILIEPDNGTVAVISVILVPLLFLSRIKAQYWVIPMVLLVLCGGIMAYQLPYVRGRIEVYLHPEKDLRGKGHQPYQAKIAAGSGGVLGRGLGQSLQKLTYLPEAQNDYIAAIYAEETGFIGIAFLILCYMMIAFSGFAMALKVKKDHAVLILMAMIVLICFQAFCNLGVVSGLLPSKGVNLPFFSQGGTSLIANIIALTLVLNIGKKETQNLT